MTVSQTAAHAEESLPGSQPKFEIPSLDGIRLVAFLWVFLAHAGLDRVVPGGFGVTIFFFLSGYLITTLLRREHDRYRSVSLRHFYMRRAVRIWPAFYLVLFIGLALTLAGALPGDLRATSVLAQVVHFGNYGVIANGSEHVVIGTEVYWSLAVEEHFYLLFPVLYLVLRKLGASSRTVVAVVLTCCVAVLAWRCVLVIGLDAGSVRTYYGSDTRVDGILFGCALAVAANPALDRNPFSDRTWKVVLLPLGIATVLSTFVIRNETFRETVRYTLQGVGLVPLFYCAVRFPTWGVIRWLNISWVKFLGVMTYSLYLVHYTVLQTLEHHLSGVPAVPRGVLALAVSVALSLAVYNLVERPLAPLRHRLGRR